MGGANLHYTFTCPNCSGNFSIKLDRIPPVQARFRCPHCKEPMDFPSREEARVYARLQAEAADAPDPPPQPKTVSRVTSSLDDASSSLPPENARFRVDKPGWEGDIFDRRDIRNFIRTGEILETDHIGMDDGPPVAAGELPYLKSLFSLRKSARVKPPIVCRSHTDKVAFFKCRDTGRPLCIDCAPEKKFGVTTIRVCQHCGQTALELEQA